MAFEDSPKITVAYFDGCNQNKTDLNRIETPGVFIRDRPPKLLIVFTDRLCFISLFFTIAIGSYIVHKSLIIDRGAVCDNGT